jgi:hypothetical protein
LRINNPPNAKDLMATARSFGNYDLAAALADLIDNSIKAKASKIAISFEPKDFDVSVRIRDDGLGMGLEALIAAMRPASANPQDYREPDDLGRFGWGLKSASFSQAKVLTVISWCEGSIQAARWDIDNIENWEMEILEGEDAKNLLVSPQNSKSGTEVLWTRSDRLLDWDNSSSFDEALTFAIAHATQRLSLVFHRFLSGEISRPLAISINDRALYAIDPFMTGHNATQTLDAEVIKTASSSIITIQPYVLPHFSKLTVEEQERLGGPEGMVRNQGFYVYRNKRLIIFGTWFRLVPHGELSQLTRIRVDLPNTVDAEWRITVDKSDAQLPTALKRRLREVVKRFNKRSLSVHRKKGVSIDLPEVQSVWLRYVKNGSIFYRVNRDHPMVANLLNANSQTGDADSVIRLIESYFPTDKFLADGNGADVNQGYSSVEDFEVLINQCVLNFLQSSGSSSLSVERFLEFIRAVEPFASQWAYTESYVKKNTAKRWGMKNGF